MHWADPNRVSECTIARVTSETTHQTVHVAMLLALRWPFLVHSGALTVLLVRPIQIVWPQFNILLYRLVQ